MRFWLILAEVLLCGLACLTGMNAVLLAIAGGPAIGFGFSLLLCVVGVVMAFRCGFVRRGMKVCWPGQE
jgi:hypothetical protein